jgi:hypothetical protein
MPQSGVAMSRGDRDDGESGNARPLERRAGGSTARGLEALEYGGGGGVPGRRTVTIRGQGAERNIPRRPSGSRRPSERRHERAGFRPDRAAMWAVLLGLMLILAAVASAHS